ncbi:MAG TPA: RDD family protein [Segetibacter sp.]
MNIISITTSQNIELEYELGSVGDRILGSIIDGIIKTAYAIIVMATFVFGNSRVFSGLYIVFLVLLALPFVFYNLASELLLDGQSVGKKVMGIKVISLSGERPSFSQYLNRWLFRLVDFTLSGNMIGVIMIAATEKKQRLGDLVAGTVLVKTAPRTQISNTLFEPTDAATYSVTYPEVINLKDRDVQLIKEIILSVMRTGNPVLATRAQHKIEEVLRVKSRHSDPISFLQSILADYNHLTS